MEDHGLKDSFPPPRPSQQEVDSFVIAVGGGKEDAVTAFLDKYAGAIDQKNIHGNTALIYAAWMGQSAMAGLLLEKGANIDAQSDSGLTALMCAAWRGRAEVVKLLLEKGASIDEIKGNGKTAKMLAREQGHSEVVALLDAYAERRQRQEQARAEVKIKDLTDTRLEKLKSRRPPQSPFKKPPPKQKKP